MEDDPDWPEEAGHGGRPRTGPWKSARLDPKDSDPACPLEPARLHPGTADFGRATGPVWRRPGMVSPGTMTPVRPGGPARTDEPGGAPATDGLRTRPRRARQPGPNRPCPASPPGERTGNDRQTWAPAPTLEDAVADWDRLAAGVQTGSRVARAERWTAQIDADVANEWPGPPLRAARLAAISGGLTAADQPGPVAGAGPGAPATKEPDVPAKPAAPAGPGALNGPGAPAEPGPPPDSAAKASQRTARQLRTGAGRAGGTRAGQVAQGRRRGRPWTCPGRRTRPTSGSAC